MGSWYAITPNIVIKKWTICAWSFAIGLQHWQVGRQSGLRAEFLGLGWLYIGWIAR